MSQTKKRTIIAFVIVAMIAIFFLSFAPTITWDGAHYFNYLQIFEHAAPWSSWDIVRGPVFPIILYLGTYLFGKTVQGLLIMMMIFYFLMLFVVKWIMDHLLKEEKNKVVKYAIYIVTFLLIVINPIIFGYYHTILTEFAAITLAMVMCYLSWRWLDYSWEKGRSKFVILSLSLIAGTVIAWHLKQPYVGVTLFPAITAFVLSLFTKRGWKNFISRGLVILMCVIALAASLSIWSTFLKHRGVNFNTSRNVTAGLGKQLVSGVNNFELVNMKKLNEDKIKDAPKLTKDEKEKLIKDKNNYQVVNIKTPKGKLVDQEILKANKGNISTGTALTFLAKSAVTHPYIMLEAYGSGYLALANIYPKESEDGVGYTVVKKFDIDYCHENCIIGTSVTTTKSNIFPIPDELMAKVSQYQEYNAAPIPFRKILDFMAPVAKFLYRFLILILPIAWIVSIVVRSVMKKLKASKKRLLDLSIILLTFSLLHNLAHVVTGAQIDRYASPNIIPILLALIIMLYIVMERKIRNRKGVQNEKEKDTIDHSSL